MESLIANLRESERTRPGEKESDCEHTAFLTKAYYENPDEGQRARLLINGEEVKRGTVEQMKEAFRLQTGIDVKANIAVQMWQKQPLSGKPAGFVTIQSRAVRTIK